MNLDFTPEEEAFRERARTWLAEHLPSEERPAIGQPMREFDLAWQRTLFDGGWAGINWPKEYGGKGLNDIQQMIWYEEFARADPPFTLNNSCTFVGNNHGGPTLIVSGTDEQKAFHLPKILGEREAWIAKLLEEVARLRIWRLPGRRLKAGEQAFLDRVRAQRPPS